MISGASLRPWAVARQAQRNRLAALALLVFGAHAIVVTARGPAAWPGRAHEGRAAVQIRLVESAPTVDSAPAQAAATAALTDQSGARAVDRGHAPNRQTATRTTAVQAEVASKAWIADKGDPYADHLPRSALTVGPRPSQPVLIDFPEFVGAAARYAAEFEILVDDTGGVVHVASVDPELPLILLQAVRDAFLPVRFSPGEVDGHPVRSRFRIEVTFDSEARQG